MNRIYHLAPCRSFGHIFIWSAQFIWSHFQWQIDMIAPYNWERRKQLSVFGLFKYGHKAKQNQNGWTQIVVISISTNYCIFSRNCSECLEHWWPFRYFGHLIHLNRDRITLISRKLNHRLHCQQICLARECARAKQTACVCIWAAINHYTNKQKLCDHWINNLHNSNCIMVMPTEAMKMSNK